MKKLETGDIGLSRTHFHILKPKTWLALIIRVLIGCKYNHVWTVVRIHGKLYIIEVDDNGCHLELAETRLKPQEADYLILKPYSKYSDTKTFRNFSEAEELEYVDECLSVAGRVGYGEWTLIYHHLRQLLGLRWKQKPEAYMDDFVCSEFAAWKWRQYFPEWHRMNPKHILDSQHFSRHPYKPEML